MTQPLLLSGQYLLTLDAAHPCIEDGALLARDGRIAAIGTRAELAAHHPGVRALHTPHGLIMPGLMFYF